VQKHKYLIVRYSEYILYLFCQLLVKNIRSWQKQHRNVRGDVQQECDECCTSCLAHRCPPTLNMGEVDDAGCSPSGLSENLEGFN